MDILNWPQDLVLLLPVRLIAFSPRANHHPLALSLAPSIGKKFAMTEMLTVLAMLTQKFEFELLSPDYEWKFRPLGITLRPLDGMPLRVKPRSTASFE